MNSDPLHPETRPGHAAESPTHAAPAGVTPAAGRPPRGDLRLQPGRRIGPYRILGPLGAGGMATVCRAEQIHLGRCVALKVLPERLAGRPDSLERFRREMKSIGRISSPRIVQAFDAGEADGFVYIAMELIDGVDLRQLVKARGALRVPEACQLISQAALALAAAHRAGMVHRDVKPSNLMLTRAGEVKLLDLGLARLAEERVGDDAITAADEWVGTPDYMAPEQWDDPRLVDHRADLYALGCTLFHLLAGRPPFSGERLSTHASKMKAHTIATVPDLRPLRVDLPEEVVRLCERLLAKSPADRPQSMDELVAALAPFTGVSPALEGTEIDSESSTVMLSPPESPRRRQRSGWVGRAAVGIGLAILAGLIAVPFLRSPARGPIDGSAPPKPVPAAVAPEPWDAASVARERNAAEWVLTQNGKIDARIEDAEEEMLASLPLPDRRFRITTVYLGRRPQVTDDGLAALNALPALSLLELNHDTGLTDRLFESLGQLPSLVEINLARTQVTDRCWEWLREQTTLTKVDLWGTKIEGEGLASLQGSRVRWLRLGGTRIGNEAFQAIESFPALRILELTSTDVTAEFLPHLARVAPGLERLAIDGTKAEFEEGIDWLSLFPALTDVQFNGSALTGEAQASLRHVPRLAHVGFGFDIPDIDPERFPETVREVEWLWTETPPARAATEFDWQLPGVETVRLSYITRGGNYAGMLGCCPNATRVILKEAHDFAESDIEALARLPKLRTVRIDASSPSALQHLPRLRTLRPDVTVETLP